MRAVQRRRIQALRNRLQRFPAPPSASVPWAGVLQNHGAADGGTEVATEQSGDGRGEGLGLRATVCVLSVYKNTLLCVLTGRLVWCHLSRWLSACFA